MTQQLALGTGGEINFTKRKGRKRKDGTYGPSSILARRNIRDWQGETREITAMGKTQTQAAEKLVLKTKDELAMVSGNDQLQPTSLVGEAAEVWITKLWNDTRRKNPRRVDGTVAGYERDYQNHVHREIGKVRIFEVTPAVCQQVIDTIEAKYSEDAARKAATILRAVFDTAIFHKARRDNPMAAVETPQKTQNEVIAFTPTEIARLRCALWTADLEALKSRRPGPKPTFHLPVLVDVLLGTGARIGEILAIKWRDLIIQDGKPALHLRSTVIESETEQGTFPSRIQPFLKGGSVVNPKWRIVFLPQFALDAIEFIRPGDAAPTDFVFAAQRRNKHRESKHRTIANTRKQFRNTIPENGLGDIHFHLHKIRKTVGTLVERERGLKTAGELFGHAGPTSNVTYVSYVEKTNIAPELNEILENYVAGCQAEIPLPEMPDKR